MYIHIKTFRAFWKYKHIHLASDDKHRSFLMCKLKTGGGLPAFLHLPSQHGLPPCAFGCRLLVLLGRHGQVRSHPKGFDSCCVYFSLLSQLYIIMINIISVCFQSFLLMC